MNRSRDIGIKRRLQHWRDQRWSLFAKHGVKPYTSEQARKGQATATANYRARTVIIARDHQIAAWMDEGKSSRQIAALLPDLIAICDRQIRNVMRRIRDTRLAQAAAEAARKAKERADQEAARMRNRVALLMKNNSRNEGVGNPAPSTTEATLLDNVFDQEQEIKLADIGLGKASPPLAYGGGKPRDGSDLLNMLQ